MICKELMGIMNSYAPSKEACDWDNVGLLVGDESKEIKSIYVSLDPTDEVIKEAVSLQVDLLLTHHPLLLKGIKKICREDFIGRRIYALIQNDICYCAMHTNFDLAHMGRLAAERLSLSDTEVLDIMITEGESLKGIGVVGSLPERMSLEECAVMVKEAFGLTSVKVFGNRKQQVFRAALCPGSGKSLIPDVIKAKADIFITGDIGHHEGIDLTAQNVCVIDGGHYGIEKIFITHMSDYLKRKFPEIAVYSQGDEEPFINL